MGSRLAGALLLAILCCRPAAAIDVPADIAAMVRREALRHEIDPRLVIAVMRQESAFNPRALSAKGAMGLMQLMPATARRFGVVDPWDPLQNVRGGCRYLRFLLDRYDGDPVLVLAAYNAGEGAVDRHDGVPPYAETRNYVAVVSAEAATATPSRAPPADRLVVEWRARERDDLFTRPLRAGAARRR